MMDKREGSLVEKPRFYIMDLDNYTDDFLREIILWQNERIKELEEILVRPCRRR